VAADGRRLLCGLCGGQITSGPGSVRVEDCPVHIRCFAAQFGRSDEVETLLTSLRDSPTDLSRLVIQLLRRQLKTIYLSPRPIEAWRGRDPAAWSHICRWLDRRGVEIKLTEGSATRLARPVRHETRRLGKGSERHRR
jgi:hypothetical protein